MQADNHVPSGAVCELVGGAAISLGQSEQLELGQVGIEAFWQHRGRVWRQLLPRWPQLVHGTTVSIWQLVQGVLQQQRVGLAQVGTKELSVRRACEVRPSSVPASAEGVTPLPPRTLTYSSPQG